MPAYPSMKLGLVDIRDVARAHILAMKDTRSNGERILITAETLSFKQIANTFRKEFAKKGEFESNNLNYVIWLAFLMIIRQEVLKFALYRIMLSFQSLNETKFTFNAFETILILIGKKSHCSFTGNDHESITGYRIPRFRVPYVFLWFHSMTDKVASQALSLYGHEDKLDNSKVNFPFFSSKISAFLSRSKGIISIKNNK